MVTVLRKLELLELTFPPQTLQTARRILKKGKNYSNSTLKMKNETPVVTVTSRSSLRLAPVLVIAILMAFSPTLTRADTIAFNISGGTSFFAGEDATAGYVFTLSNPIFVTSLGLFDEGGNGLNAFYNVFMVTSDGIQQMAQAVIPAGTGTTLINGFRYVSIAPVLVPAGTYKIFTFYVDSPSDPIIAQAAITSASGVFYDGSTSDVGFTFPSGNFFGFSSGYFGPNFEFTTGVVTPDSGSTVSLLGCALLGLAVLRRKLSC
jgi:hypothetical protein